MVFSFLVKFIKTKIIVVVELIYTISIKIIGTFITEGLDGFKICQRLFANRTTTDQTISKLVELAVRYNFDGWLINIENEIEVDIF